jgi:hypothetical protein
VSDEVENPSKGAVAGDAANVVGKKVSCAGAARMHVLKTISEFGQTEGQESTNSETIGIWGMWGMGWLTGMRRRLRGWEGG